MTLIDPSQLEPILKLMSRYSVDEISSDTLTIRISKHAKRNRKPNQIAPPSATDHHVTAHLQDAPWDAITDDELEQFAMTGKA